MVAAEIEILLTLLGADALLWLLGTLLIYAISHPISLPTHTAFPITKPISTNTVFATKLQTADGPIRARKLSKGEVKKLRDENGTPFEQVKSKLGYPAPADIYVDQDGNYWIVMPGSDYAEPFP